jgi:hypothetical protein
MDAQPPPRPAFASPSVRSGPRVVLDLDLSGLQVKTTATRTVLTGITVKLDPAAAGALNATFGLALPTDGSLVFGTARVAVG